MARSRHRWTSLRWSRCSFVAMLINLLSLPSVANIDAFNYFQSEQEFGRVTVDTKLGQVVGRIFPGGIQGFLGIPYALPPVDKLRFEPPVPLASWGGGKLRALEFGAECMQTTEGNPTPPKAISEDCLFLNVWTPPGTKRGSKVPVMVWLYGGGFQQGASSHPEYDGKRLAERGVVVVSINYRLGALGWMVSVSDNLWGNYGLQDQRLGLEWVHDNIASFGGDPGLVTLFGESAGAMSIGQHLHMDGAGVLFHKVIMQSNPIGYRFRSVTVANFLGEAVKRGMDCASLECLQTEPVSEVMRAQDSLMGIPRSVGDFFTWGPVVTDRNYRRHVGKHQKTWKYQDHRADEEERERQEARTVTLPGLGKKKKKKKIGGDDDDDDDEGDNRGGGTWSRSPTAAVRRGPRHDYTAPFMNVVQPLEALAEAATTAATARARGALGVRSGGGRFGGGVDDDKKAAAARARPPVPVMLGVNAHEGLMFVHGAFPLTMPRMVYLSFVLGLFRLSMPRIVTAYGKMAEGCVESGDYRAVMSQIMHDYLFRCPNLRAAQLLQEKNGQDAPVFVYEFNHPTEVPGFPACSGSSCHTAELPYVFNNMDIINESYSFHEASGPLAPAPPAPSSKTAKGQDDADGGGGPLSTVTDALGGAAMGVGSALGGAVGGVGNAVGGVGNAVGGVAGGVAGGVVGAVRSGFGVGRLFGWGGRQTASSPGEEVAGAIGGGGVGMAGRVVAGVTEKAQEVLAAAEGEGKGDAGPGERDGGKGGGGGGEEAEGRGRNVWQEDAAEAAEAVEASEAPEGGSRAAAGGDGVEVDAAGAPAAAEDEERSAAREEARDPTSDDGSDISSSSSSGSSSDASNAGTDRSGLGGSSCAVTAGDAGPTPPAGPRRPTVREAALADSRVAEAMVAYWASFGKTGDPNSASAPVVWPAWQGRRLTAQGDAAGAAAMAALLASGRGGVGKGSFSEVFEDAWSRPGAAAAAGGGGGFPGASPWEGGPMYLGISAHPEPREAQRDCMCEFWDRLKYRY